MPPTATFDATALLYVLSQPGPNLPLSEFQTWYDTDHAPLRASVPGVLTTRRYKSLSAQKPEWLAVYELSSPAVLQCPEYIAQWKNASKYETELLNRYETLDRRVYTLYSRKTRADYAEKQKEGEEAKKKRVFHTVGLQPKEGGGMTDEEFERWYEEEHIGLLSAVPGWLRSTRWKLQDVKGANMKEIDTANIPRFLAIHEWEDDSFLKTVEMKKATSTEWRTKVMDRIDGVAEERRHWGLWKEFDCS